DLYRKYGFYQEKLISLTKKGKTGADQIKQMMLDLRNNPPKSIGGVQVKEIRDYDRREATTLSSGEKTDIELPQSDVLQFITVDGDVISARPSGTEPKIKFYCSVRESLVDISQYSTIAQKLSDKIKNIMADIVKD